MSNQSTSVMNLTPEQLGQVKNQLESDIQSFEQAFEALRNARAKFLESKRSLEALGKQKTGTDIMVPLTSSLYVPGTLADASKVIVDLGTGYFAKVSIPHAVSYYTRKCDMLSSEMDKIADTANAKVRQRDQVIDILKRKLVASGQIKQ
eukprot:PhF_6_TR30681/c0_g1_i1/m.45140/K04797/pfdA, PFDN5; prefoldin alpha subunit